MNKLTQAWNSLKGFLESVQVELRKCAWPTRSELLQSTGIVAVSVALIGVFVGLSDGLIMILLEIIIR